MDLQLACYLGFLFLLGASAQLYAGCVYLKWPIALAAGLVLAGSLVERHLTLAR
ncbi:hypothetical protein [Dactylosporangium sp. NPDC049140]|uniref:hypothetical protein n=1 Tax=Dactylosporangium sp. NPDC049140 TaxID=3155647 RepID=UPI0033EF243F